MAKTNAGWRSKMESVAYEYTHILICNASTLKVHFCCYYCLLLTLIKFNSVQDTHYLST